VTKRHVRRFVLGWVGLTLLVATGMHCRAHISEAPRPDDAMSEWAMSALDAARLGEPRPEPPGSYEAGGPVFVSAWYEGSLVARHVGDADLVTAVDEAAERFGSSLGNLSGWHGSDESDLVRFTVEVTLGEGPVRLEVPYLSELGIVPLHDGLLARLDGETAYITVEELRARQAYDGGIATPVPDLALGVKMDELVGRLARDLGVEAYDLLEQGEVRRFRSHTISGSVYPREQEVTEENLRAAIVDQAEFLLRHQKRNGQYTYIYDGARGRERPDHYNIPRHSGTTYFLAQVDRLHGMPEAREGAIRALRWLERRQMRRCGEHRCVESWGRADVGSAALTVVAASEVLAKEDNGVARRLAEDLSAFLRSLQREDGELMHEFDLRTQEPIDVQHMYYSGEAAFALLKAHEVLGDEANLEAARRLMGHLTGAGWNFFGSRYYYGEEHWTCISAGEARGRVDSPEALDFCERWFEFNDAIQYREGQTPWPVEGSFGVGPVIVPRLTPVGSRTEAFIGTYQLMEHNGHDTTEIRALIERGLGQLMRYRWAPGPEHLLADPPAARGGVPGSPTDLTVRNDFVQHAGSAMIRWADVLRREREGDGS